MVVADYDIRVECLTGPENVIADALSRICEVPDINCTINLVNGPIQRKLFSPEVVDWNLMIIKLSQGTLYPWKN